MADVFTKAKRSEVMSRIRSRGNKDTELALAKLLRANGITGWRRQVEIRGGDVALRRPRPVQGRNTSGEVAPLHASGTARRSVPTAQTHGAHRVRRQAKDRTPQRAVPAFRVRPNFVFPKLRLAVFVDGCFWHGCPRHATKPKNNAAFWRKKLAGNRKRDRLVTRTLRRAGWRVVRIWECDLARRAEKCLCRIQRQSA